MSPSTVRGLSAGSPTDLATGVDSNWNRVDCARGGDPAMTSIRAFTIQTASITSVEVLPSLRSITSSEAKARIPATLLKLPVESQAVALS